MHSCSIPQESADEIRFHIAACGRKGIVHDLDVCIQKLLIISVASDCTVYLWNFESSEKSLCKSFHEENFSVSLHPSGTHALVGFSDKVLQSITKAYYDQLRFRRIWKTLAESHRPLVVHNGGFDLLFLVRHFEAILPDTLGGFGVSREVCFRVGFGIRDRSVGPMLVVAESKDE